jgi:hypothetical protein
LEEDRVNTDQLISVASQPCSVIVPIWEDWLKQAGLFVMRTFDIQESRLPAASPCSCIHHGTAQCDCQMVILLVYSQLGAPVSLLAHGSHGQTWLSFASVFEAGSNALESDIRELFELKMYL